MRVLLIHTSEVKDEATDEGARDSTHVLGCERCHAVRGLDVRLVDSNEVRVASRKAHATVWQDVEEKSRRVQQKQRSVD